MKELIKAIISALNKDSKKIRKINEEQTKQIEDLKDVIKVESTRIDLFRERNKDLERLNVTLIQDFKKEISSEINNQKGHITKESMIKLIDDLYKKQYKRIFSQKIKKEDVNNGN